MPHSTPRAPSPFEFVRAFIAAAERVMLQVFGELPQRGTPIFYLEDHLAAEPIAIALGVIGDHPGRVVYEMSPETARATAERMLDESCPELDELAMSALHELANMVSGNALVHLRPHWPHADITPPQLLDEYARRRGTGMRALGIPMSFSFGTIHMTVAVHRPARALGVQAR